MKPDDTPQPNRLLTEEENAQAIEMIKQTARVPREQVLAGAYLPYIDITSENKSIVSGGDLALFAFEHEGASFAVVDSYCLKPDCRCEELLLDFFRFGEEVEPGRCTFSVPFEGRPSLEDKVAMTDDQADAVYEEWSAVRPDWFDEKEIRQRYATIKEVGTRSLSSQPSPPAEEMPPLPSENSLRVGRNDPCPCGSGRKYKKCCLSQ